jgi:transcriptional regulator with XRE-family HTH domain
MAALPQTTLDLAASEYIRVMAKRRGITQTELGKRAGIGEATMGNYWRGKTSMTLGTLGKLLTVLGVDLDSAFEEIDRIYVALEKSEGK